MKRQVVLGLGAGQCGTMLLAQVLGRQPGARVTHEQPPLLPWVRDPNTKTIEQRLRRILDSTQERLVGDVASFYLPYLEEAIQFDPGIRIICLKRPREEIVAGFCRFLDQASPYSINHWAKSPSPGWWHDPFWTRLYPQYDTQDREEGIGLYWDEYYAAAEEFARRWPDNLRVYDTEALTCEQGVHELLSFVGIPSRDHVVLTGQRPPACAPRPAASSMPKLRYSHPLDPRKCAVLVPFSGFIHQECEDALKELERRGYQVRRVGGYAAIDQGRNQMATDALKDGFEETLWIDSDIGFHPDSVDRLRSHPHPIVCGIYPQKGRRALACHVMPGSPSMTFGERGGLAELLYAGAGFLLVRREVYLDVQRKLGLPMCNERFGHPMIPFFFPMIRPIEEAHWYLAEDYAFCQRARECGYKIMADTSIRLWHIGSCRYGWEDAGIERQRFGSFTLNFGNAPRASHTTPTERHPALANFAMQYPWPAEKPAVPPIPQKGWLLPGTEEMLKQSVSPATRLIVEIGSWLGRSTRFLSNLAPRATIIAIDHWRGSPGQDRDDELRELLPRLYEAFLAECWDYRDKIVPVKEASVEGLQHVAEAGLEPDVVYLCLDAERRSEDVLSDINTALDLFPKALIVGDDWERKGVRLVVETVASERGLRFESYQAGWRLLRQADTLGRPTDSFAAPAQAPLR